VNQVLVDKTREYRELVQKYISAYLEHDEPRLLYEPMRYALESGGKMLRPILALVSCGAVGGNIKDTLNAAAALELAHNFTLVHDDIMDNDGFRRGRETVYKKWDANIGILSGDALLVKAYEALATAPPQYLPRLLREFNNGILMVCEGQAMDLEFEDRSDVTLDEYFQMIDRKTAQLFSLSCTIGAILGDGTEKQIKALQSFGSMLGYAFQIQDDLLDILSDQETLGKDIGSDLQADKKTFLMLYTRENASEKELRTIAKLMQKKSFAVQDIQQIREIFQRIGTLDAAKGEVKRALTAASAELNQLEENEFRSILSSLLETLENRTF